MTDINKLYRIENNLRRAGVLSWVYAFCVKHNISFFNLLDTDDRTLTTLRHEVWCVVHDTLGLSYPKTGQLFEVDHTSILHAWRAKQEKLVAA